jgi:hypothetical protein
MASNRARVTTPRRRPRLDSRCREKSSIRHAARATLLGFGFFFDGPRVGIRIAPKAIQRLKDQLRMLTRRRWSVSMDYRIGRLNRLITGWVAYFRLAERVSILGKLLLVRVPWAGATYALAVVRGIPGHPDVGA